MSTVYLVERIMVAGNGTMLTETCVVFDDKEVALKGREDRQKAVGALLATPVQFPGGPAVTLGQILSDLGIKGIDHRVQEIEVKGGDLIVAKKQLVTLS